MVDMYHDEMNVSMISPRKIKDFLKIVLKLTTFESFFSLNHV